MIERWALQKADRAFARAILAQREGRPFVASAWLGVCRFWEAFA